MKCNVMEILAFLDRLVAYIEVLDDHERIEHFIHRINTETEIRMEPDHDYGYENSKPRWLH